MPARKLALLTALLAPLAVVALLLLDAEGSATPERSAASPADLAAEAQAEGRAGPASVNRGGPRSAASRRERLRRIQSTLEWRDSRAIGTHTAGRLIDGIKLPREGLHFFTWDSADWTRTSSPFRRHGTERLIRVILRVARGFARDNPGAPRIAVGDLSLPRGGRFASEYGGVGEFGKGRDSGGHVSHQNGLDVDVFYPRRDRRERGPDSLADVDLKLAQDLVDRFVAAGAQFVFVGPSTGLRGPSAVVQPLVLHDDHMHVRLPSK